MPLDLEDYKHAEYNSGLPDEAQLIAMQHSNPDKIAARLLEATFVGSEIGTGKAWLGHMQRLGVAAVSAPEMGAFQNFSAALSNTPAASFQNLAGGAMDCVASNGDDCGDFIVDEMLSQVSGYFTQAMTSIPIIGWIVEWAATLVQVGYTIWTEAQGEPPTQLAPLQVSAKADQDDGRELVNLMGTDDWTNIWMPEHNASAGGWLQAPEVGYPLGPGGTEVHYGWRLWMAETPFQEGSAGGSVNWTGGFGFLPGRAAMARQWQIRGTQASTGNSRLDRILKALNLPISHGTGDASEVGKFTTYGMEYYLPSVGNLATTAWAQVNKVSGAMYKVDTHRLANAWYDYWMLWRAALGYYTDRGEDVPARIILGILGGNKFGDEFADWPMGMSQGQMVEVIPEKYRTLIRGTVQEYGKEISGYLPHDPPDCVNPGPNNPDCGGGPFTYRKKKFVIGDGLTMGVDQWGITLRFLDNLYDRQAYGVRTLQCAYLTGNEPGLQGQGSNLFQLWKNMRNLLLEHSSLGSVDFDRVPKEDYTGTGEWRAEAIQRKISGTFSIAPNVQETIEAEPILKDLKQTPMLAPSPGPWGAGGFLNRMSTAPQETKPAYVNLGGQAVTARGLTASEVEAEEMGIAPLLIGGAAAAALYAMLRK